MVSAENLLVAHFDDVLELCAVRIREVKDVHFPIFASTVRPFALGVGADGGWGLGAVCWGCVGGCGWVVLGSIKVSNTPTPTPIPTHTVQCQSQPHADTHLNTHTHTHTHLW